MAGIHSGLIENESCDQCSDDLKRQKGCIQPLQNPVWVIDNFKFFVCPLSWLTLQISYWYNKYKLIRDGICLPEKYENMAAKFIEAISVYERYLKELKAVKDNNKKIASSFEKLKEIKNGN